MGDNVGSVAAGVTLYLPLQRLAMIVLLALGHGPQEPLRRLTRLPNHA